MSDFSNQVTDTIKIVNSGVIQACITLNMKRAHRIQNYADYRCSGHTFRMKVYACCTSLLNLKVHGLVE